MNNRKSHPAGRDPRALFHPDREPAPVERISRIDSSLLLGETGRVVIEHHGQRYELRETRFGKLILTK